MIDRREEGSAGEEKAESALRRKGYRVIERNHRNPCGEIDIVAEHKGYLVFVEVKKRNTPYFGDPLDAIDKRKKDHIVKSALYYMKKNKCADRKVRFDVVGITGDTIKIVKNAFAVDET